MSTVIRPPRRGQITSPEASSSAGERSDALIGRLLLDAGKLTAIDVNRVTPQALRLQPFDGQPGDRVVAAWRTDSSHRRKLPPSLTANSIWCAAGCRPVRLPRWTVQAGGRVHDGSTVRGSEAALRGH